VHRVPLPLPTDGLRAVNVYVIEDDGGLVLIDSGWALEVARRALTSALATLGAGLGDVRSFLVTHVHRDHYTLAVQLRREFRGTVSLGLGERQAIAALSGGTAEPFAPQLAELRASGADGLIGKLGDAAGALPGGAADWEEPDKWLTPHQEIGVAGRALTVIATPGHTRGHVVFRDAAAGLLFAGDHVLPHITPSIGFEAVPSRQPLQDFLGSLRLVRDGAATAYQAAGFLRWTRRERQLGELDPFNQMLAVIETRAHLELLAAQGRLVSSVQDGVVFYEVPGLPPR